MAPWPPPLFSPDGEGHRQHPRPGQGELLLGRADVPHGLRECDELFVLRRLQEGLLHFRRQLFGQQLLRDLSVAGKEYYLRLNSDLAAAAAADTNLDLLSVN